jgi:putative transposase
MLHGMYRVFGISLRDHELVVADRGVVVMRESIRHCLKFGADLAGRQRRRPLPGDTWHLDDVLIRIMGVSHYLRPGSTRTGVLDILVQDWRNRVADKHFSRRLLYGLTYKPRSLVTDGLRGYGVAQRAVLPNV